MASSLIKLFKEQLENESKSIASQYGLEKRGDYLIWWYFLRLTGIDPSIVQEIVCDGSADLGIDAIWIDDEEIVHFYAFKNPENVDAMLGDALIEREKMSSASDPFSCAAGAELRLDSIVWRCAPCRRHEPESVAHHDGPLAGELERCQLHPAPGHLSC